MSIISLSGSGFSGSWSDDDDDSSISMSSVSDVISSIIHELFEVFVSLLESDSVETELVEVRTWTGFVVGATMGGAGWVGLGAFSERMLLLVPVVGLISCVGSFFEVYLGL